MNERVQYILRRGGGGGDKQGRKRVEGTVLVAIRQLHMKQGHVCYKALEMVLVIVTEVSRFCGSIMV